MRALVLVVAATLAGCGFKVGNLFTSETRIDVREIGRSLYCNTPAETAGAVLLDGPQAVLQWQSARGITLAGPENLAQTPYAVVEMGLRPTGGYGVAVSRAAVLSGERVILRATFVSPAPGSLRTQALSSPCVLVQLPAGRYAEVEVLDQTGAVRATGGRPTSAPAAGPAAPASGMPAETPTPAPSAPTPAPETPDDDVPAA